MGSPRSRGGRRTETDVRANTCGPVGHWEHHSSFFRSISPTGSPASRACNEADFCGSEIETTFRSNESKSSKEGSRN
ncbi:hypothetical protein BT69DRAFT_698508 [Atractiella rhizophila]|nr:hypothetical protein BT69DRAFT_698508 [Atractiella rhizophila]